MTLRYTANEAAPACEADEVTPSDANDIAGGPARALYVGGTGDVSILTRGGRTVVFRAVPAGSTKTVAASGLDSSVAFGSSTVAKATPQALSPSGIGSVAAIGTASVSKVAARTISAGSVASVAAIGTQTVAHVTAQVIAPSGIPTSTRFGSTLIEGGGSPSAVRAWLRRISISIGIGL